MAITGATYLDNLPNGTLPVALSIPVGTRGLLVYLGTNENFVSTPSSVHLAGSPDIPMPPVQIVVGGVPRDYIEGDSGTFAGQPLRVYFLPDPPTGAQSLVVAGPAAAMVNVYMVASTDPLEANACVGLWSASVANPSLTVPLGGRSSLVTQTGYSGQDAVGGVTPRAGWTQRAELDIGTEVVLSHQYNTIGSADVNAGWTQTADEALFAAVAIAEVEDEPVEPVELELIGGVEAGAEASLRVMRPLALEGGTAAGAAAALLVTRTLGIDAGAATGAEAQLQVTRRLEGAAGADAGADASLQVTRRMTVEAGAEAGGQASLQITRALAVEGGAITGAEAFLQAVRRLQLIGGATAGLDARFASAPGELSLEGGASVGAEVTLRVGRRLAMEGGAAAGGAAELRVTRILAPSQSVMPDARDFTASPAQRTLGAAPAGRSFTVRPPSRN